MQVSHEMQVIIRAEIQRIEQEQDVKILYACESGSRAWGFPSLDSDYDVRFVYVHKPEWYLSIFQRRDVIEYPISDQLDVNGWDLIKALNLFRKSNPPLLEWLASPIVYHEAYSLAEQIRQLSPLGFSPRACMYHYLHMAKGNDRGYLQGEMVKSKKYFYVLRPVLACRWIVEKGTIPPMSFHTLVDELLPDGLLKSDIHKLLQRKMSGEELDLEPRIVSIHEFLALEIPQLEQLAGAQVAPAESMDDRLDQLFRDTLSEVWHTSSTIERGLNPL